MQELYMGILRNTETPFQKVDLPSFREVEISSLLPSAPALSRGGRSKKQTTKKTTTKKKDSKKKK